MSDQDVAERAKAHGAHFSLRIVIEAKHADIPVSLGFALIEQESAFTNVWGHDPAPNGGTSHLGGRTVTKAAYLAYKQRRGSRGQGGMQGVGPAQLTWYEFQDQADRLGGCWKPACNIAVSFKHLGKLIDARGTRAGLVAYNGSGAAASHYADAVLGRARGFWHHRLT
jgi:hypothetical protein